MKDVRTIISELREKNVRLSLNGDKLEVESLNNKLTNEIIEEIRTNKEKIIEYLNKRKILDNAGNDIIDPIAQSESYQPSSSQRRLWILNQLNDKSAAYNVVSTNIFEGDLNIKCLLESFLEIIKRHEILRTVFKLDNSGDVRQFIKPINEISFDIPVINFQLEGDKKNLVQAAVTEEINKPFDLANGPLVRAKLYQLEINKWILVCNMHHIISDAWSVRIFTEELLINYNSLIKGESVKTDPLPIQFKDYAAWEQKQLSGKKLDEHKMYWLKQFSGELPVIDLPLDYVRPPEKTFMGDLYKKVFDEKIVEKLIYFIKEREGSLYMGLISAVNILLNKYTSQQDLIIGSPTAGREKHELGGQIGFYVNTLCLRSRIADEDDFERLFAKVKKTVLEGYQHQIFPFDELVNELEIPRVANRSVLFDVMVGLDVLDKNKEDSNLNLGNIVVKPYEESLRPVSKFDLLFDFIQDNNKLVLAVEYSTDIFKKETIQRLCLHLERIMDQVVNEPLKKISELDYMTADERNEVLVNFNDTSVKFSDVTNLLGLFENQVKATPDLNAIVFKENILTYAQLNARANQFARYLHKNYSIRSNDCIGIQIERSDWVIVAILGILKTGACYVAIDPNYPDERIELIRKNSKCIGVVSQAELGEFKLKEKEHSDTNLETPIGRDNLAYIVYTSGSTGIPKGIMITHSGIVNTILSQRKILNIESGDRGLQFASFSFDASISETFMAITSGACLYIVDEERKKDPGLIEDFILKNEIDFATIPPAYLQLMNINNIRNLKKLITAGEAPFKEKVLQFSEFGRYFNAYGPSETSICATMFELNKHNLDPNEIIPIGSPIANTKIYVLDPEDKIVPIGISGEICVGGMGLSIGYLDNDLLTSEKFIVNPFCKDELIYKTGDFGKWLPDGNLVFLGRKDEQVKIRGYRIELGEIESALEAYHAVKRAIVVVRAEKTGEKKLIACLECINEVNITSLRESLVRKLPDYMIPSQFIQLERFPLTVSGKIDRKFLEQYKGNSVESGTDYVAPSNQIETRLVEIYAEILDKPVNEVSVIDNFFDLGGNSLKIIMASKKINNLFNRSDSVTVLFTYPSIRELSQFMLENENQSVISEEFISKSATELEDSIAAFNNINNEMND
jgi:amino acid adenylation domain-containing protein